MAEITKKWWVASTSCFVSYSVLHQIPLFYPAVIEKKLSNFPTYMGPSSLNPPDKSPYCFVFAWGPPQEMADDRCITPLSYLGYLFMLCHNMLGRLNMRLKY